MVQRLHRRNGLQQLQRLQMVKSELLDLALQAHKTFRQGDQQSVVQLRSARPMTSHKGA
jgi:hypothetical protein